MTLSEFVQRTIEEVISGVKAAHGQAVSNGASIAVARNCAEVQFDVAVSSIAGSESSQAAGIFVGPL